MKDPPEELRLPPGKFTFKNLNHAVSLLAKLLRRFQEILTMRKRKREKAAGRALYKYLARKKPRLLVRKAYLRVVASVNGRDGLDQCACLLVEGLETLQVHKTRLLCTIKHTPALKRHGKETVCLPHTSGLAQRRTAWAEARSTSQYHSTCSWRLAHGDLPTE
jgi:hypothetical protein